MARKIYTTEFKREAASLVLDSGYPGSEACEAMGVGATAPFPGVAATGRGAYPSHDLLQAVLSVPPH